ncbi:glycoside hydrolase family 43 protein [Chondrinema litorale]|uniref:glycoside hydrolase family 43 protein n=1 Tax=Chondrinema litorale TaxID=2994555 RepID=UPI0025432C95|nr:glycoside hydrolase family 43 protein [Chondrinema litorale]UZR96276.1 glycoside hydrolase family 43 protein [Chondrinema litorale]
MRKLRLNSLLPLMLIIWVSCAQKKQENEAITENTQEVKTTQTDSISPIITDIYTADPSAHVFDGKLYLYPSHDYESGIPEDDLGSHFNMKDYHVFSMDKVGGEITDHGLALSVEDVPWAARQMWAPDATEKDGTYYLYFPAKDENDIFKIGVATSKNPGGPFKAEPTPITGSFSIDPAVFADNDGNYYMYFGGIWGGQLQRWQTGTYQKEDTYPADDQPALSAKVVKLSDDMLSFAEEPKDVQLIDENGSPILTGDNNRRFFEAAWVHYYNGKYYFSYSTGDTHYIAYATGDSPYGPFTYQGVILKPVLGWTNHHSIVEHQGQWYLFFHDSSLSGGKTHLRSVKVVPLEYDSDGKIKTIDAMVQVN